jgi:putative heme-binding domain-containing protein
MEHYAAIVRNEDIGADAGRGKVLFQRACASCHILFGEGGKIGPDLTGSQRSNLQYLLENIVDPSAQVAENFRMSIVVLADGRVINGIVGSETEQTITVQTPTDNLVVLKDDIEELRLSQLSIMPENLLEPLAPQEVRDLFDYLMQAQPLPQ